MEMLDVVFGVAAGLSLLIAIRMFVVLHRVVGNSRDIRSSMKTLSESLEEELQ